MYQLVGGFMKDVASTATMIPTIRIVVLRSRMKPASRSGRNGRRGPRAGAGRALRPRAPDAAPLVFRAFERVGFLAMRPAIGGRVHKRKGALRPRTPFPAVPPSRGRAAIA